MSLHSFPPNTFKLWSAFAACWQFLASSLFASVRKSKCAESAGNCVRRPTVNAPGSTRGAPARSILPLEQKWSEAGKSAIKIIRLIGFGHDCHKGDLINEKSQSLAREENFDRSRIIRRRSHWSSEFREKESSRKYENRHLWLIKTTGVPSNKLKRKSR